MTFQRACARGLCGSTIATGYQKGHIIVTVSDCLFTLTWVIPLMLHGVCK